MQSVASPLWASRRTISWSRVTSTRVPLASDVELGAFLGAAALGMISILLMTFLGFAENDLDIPLFLPLSVGPILLGGLLLLTGAGLAFRTVRRRRSTSAA